jgi:hypothetical protein
MTTAREVRNVTAPAHSEHVSHLSWSIAQEAAPVAVMVWVVTIGHSGAAMLAGGLALALLSIAYAPSARRRLWAREHLVDLWAMVLVMLLLAVSGGVPSGGAGPDAPAGHSHGHAALSLGAGASGAGGAGSALGAIGVLAVVLAWVLGRVLVARGGWRIHSLVSALVCGAGLAWMPAF